MSDRLSTAPPGVLNPPAHVRELVEALERAGYEAWCVGGAVRDALLGLPHLDWDLATSATPDQMRNVFKRTIPVGEQFGTLGVLDRAGRMHEVTTFRHDVKTDGRHAVVQFGASLDEDLARRDFTINAIAYSPSKRELRDPFGGVKDLERRTIRAVGDARQRMVEDRLRALRAVRFAGRFDFVIDAGTWRAIEESAPSLRRLSPERVQQELVKTMQQVRNPSQCLALWKRAGAFAQLMPLIEAQPEYALHAADCIARPDASRSEPRSERLTQLRLATLFVGLREARSQDVLRSLRFSKRAIARIAHLAQVAEVIAGELEGAAPMSSEERGVRARRWAARAGRVDLSDAMRVAIASLSARRGTADAADATAHRSTMRNAYRHAVRIAWRDPVEISDLAVDGEDLQSAGIPGGRALGEVLRELMEWVIADPARNTRDLLLRHAGEVLQRAGHS